MSTEKVVPFISVVIPARNEERYIRQCLESVLKQNYPHDRMEVLVVDNGSDDATANIANELLQFNNLGMVLHKGCGTIAALRNFGARNAHGSVLVFLDADCIVDTNWIQYCVDRLSCSRIGIVGTRAVPDFSQSTWVEDGWYQLVSGVERPDYPKWIGSSNMFVQKDVFFDLGGFDENLETAEDVEFCKKIAAKFLVCLEKRINTIHLRESKTIPQMFKREVWRGNSSLREMLISNNKLGDLKSVLIPLLINLLCILSIGGICLNSKLKFAGLVIFLFPLAMMINKKAICRTPKDASKVYIVSMVYLFSRAIAIIAELILILKLHTVPLLTKIIRN